MVAWTKSRPTPHNKDLPVPVLVDSYLLLIHIILLGHLLVAVLQVLILVRAELPGIKLHKGVNLALSSNRSFLPVQKEAQMLFTDQQHCYQVTSDLIWYYIPLLWAHIYTGTSW